MLTICQAQVNDAELLHDMAYAPATPIISPIWQNKDELANFLAQEYALPVLQQSLQDRCCWLIAASDGIPVGFAKFSWHAAASPQGPSGTLLHKLYFRRRRPVKVMGKVLSGGNPSRAGTWRTLPVAGSAGCQPAGPSIL
jgi:hypothetical protein